MKYRKKPVVIDAIQVTKVCSLNWDKFGLLPDWIREAHGKGILSIGDTHVSINTLEGTMKGEYTDMIIKGVSGELYPCKLDIFEATYDKVMPAPVNPPRVPGDIPRG